MVTHKATLEQQLLLATESPVIKQQRKRRLLSKEVRLTAACRGSHKAACRLLIGLRRNVCS